MLLLGYVCILPYERGDIPSGLGPEFVLDTELLFLVAELMRWTWKAHSRRLCRRLGEKEPLEANPIEVRAD